MRHVVLTAFIAVFSLTNVFARPAATALNDCVPALDNLYSVTASVTSLTAKEQQGLLNIVAAAKSKYLSGKTGDALQKLGDYGVKLDQLDATLSTPKPKISVEDSQRLRTALNEAIGCLSSGG